MTKKQQAEKAKGDAFTQGIPTKIWKEQSTESNPFIAEKAYCYGYDYEEILDKLSYVDTLYLMLSGALPTSSQSKLLELCMKLFITPGPRHPATRAAMNAGIGRTHVTHILPIALSVLSADYLGSKEVGASMQFIYRSVDKNVSATVQENLIQFEKDSCNPLPGFGTVYNGFDQLTLKSVERVKNIGCSLKHFDWCSLLVTELQKHNASWLPTGLAAALFLDLNLDYRIGISLFQMLQSPGIIAHGVEKANKPLTDMPFVSEDNYDIQK